MLFSLPLSDPIIDPVALIKLDWHMAMLEAQRDHRTFSPIGGWRER